MALWMRNLQTMNNLMAFSTNCITDQTTAKNVMVQCIKDIRKYLTTNKLCNNSEKTELLIIGTKQQLAKLNIQSITVNGTIINKATHARNLGVIFDENLSMERQVKKMCRSGYFHLKNISAMRKNINKKDTEKIVHAFISSTLDYGNTLLYGIAQTNLSKLQVLQNSAARLIEKVGRRDHITDTLIKLHWLPVKARIEFKILLFTWKALNNLAPLYIKNMLKLRDSSRNLRQPINLSLDVPHCNRITLGGNAFSVAAPTLWNQLPIETRTATSETSFRNMLKTFLFKKHYNL